MNNVINQKYIINAPANKVWEALTNPKIIEKWSQSKATMNDSEGTNFKLWDGDIFGKNIRVIKNKELVQEWTSGDWEKPSTVTFKLKELDNKTEVTLTHIGVPESEIEDIDNGWKDYYMNPLKEVVEKL
jgi:activator of HSP90 ATPase